MAKGFKKKVHVLEYELPLKVEAQEEGGFLARSNALQGVLAEGESVSEAVANAIDVAAAIIEISQQKGMAVSLKRHRRKTSGVYTTTVPVQVETA